MKKKSFLLLLMCFSFILAVPQPSFASESINYETNEPFIIDVNNMNYVVVSDEEVILDYMTKMNTDRETAIKELGINENKINGPCTGQWRSYTTTRREVESISTTSLEIYPYIEVMYCNGKDTFLSVSSAKPGHAFYGPFSGRAELPTAQAFLESKTIVRVLANGYVDPYIGGKRYFQYSDTVSPRGGGSGSDGDF